ncbi:E3 ubiquitin-protein ligase TRIM45-like [Saccostrea cucullata]|uniref:E3 ubiquitin-protein ligase TRIM45-like n=1 Tax=Saccostrea cuccullata TaxID=36930 RepID=UPI002ED0ADA0
MATYGAESFAQHYIECENCEESPAQYLCKTCAGHLCETCKTEHMKRKITKNHDIIHLISDKGEGMELLYCSEHTTKKLDCFCCPCEKPVCVKCLMETHNGHKVDNLATVYKKIKQGLEKEKEEIETSLLPKYRELLSEEKDKQSEISKKTNEVQKEIEDHAEKIINKIIMIKEKKIKDLRKDEKMVLDLAEDAKQELENRIGQLEKILTQIDNNIGANPGITFFRAIDESQVNEIRKFPRKRIYKLDKFHAGNIDRIAKEEYFGNLPNFQVERERSNRQRKRTHVRRTLLNFEKDRVSEGSIHSDEEDIQWQQKCADAFYRMSQNTILTDEEEIPWPHEGDDEFDRESQRSIHTDEEEITRPYDIDDDS